MNSELSGMQLADIELKELPSGGLVLELNSSHLLLIMYIAFFMLILLSLSLLPIPVWLIIFLLMTVSAYFQFMFRKHLLLNLPESINKLVFTDTDWCFVQLNNSRILKATILPETILTEHLVILNVKEVSKKGSLYGNYHILITALSVTENKFWQLKRYLCFKNLNSDSEPD